MNGRLGNERGSVVVALLVAIVVGGVVVALTASVLQGQRSARFDRNFTTAVTGADAGVQQVANQIIRGQIDPDRDDPVGTVYPVDSATLNAGDTTQTDYTWTAEKSSPIAYTLTGTGVTGPDGTSRTITAEVRDYPLFTLAAFADSSMNFTGSNGADSYGETTWDTGNGIVGTNGDVVLHGISTGVDGVHLYNWDNYASTSRCTHTGGPGCDDVLTMPDATAPSMRIGPKLEVLTPQFDLQFVHDKLAECGTPLQSWTASVDGPVLGPQGGESAFCVQNLTFDVDTTVSSPVQIFVAGEIATSNHVDVNMVASPPDSADLQIFSAGGRVTIGNHNKIAAGIYAPASECIGNGANAQTEVFGSMVCKTIENQGGWQFHYDDRLGEIGTNYYRLVNWREEQ